MIYNELALKHCQVHKCQLSPRISHCMSIIWGLDYISSIHIKKRGEVSAELNIQIYFCVFSVAKNELAISPNLFSIFSPQFNGLGLGLNVNFSFCWKSIW